jgi:nuclear pore complex protein Nup85
MEELPPDPTDVEDMFHSTIFSFKIEQALEFAARIDLWLAAHAADLVQLVGLVSSDVNEE